MKLLKTFLRYVTNVFDLSHQVKRVRDRRNPARCKISTQSALLAWILGFAAHVRSREELGRLLDRRGPQRLVGCHISSDSLARIAGKLDYSSLREQLLYPIIRQMRRNKCWTPGSIGRFVVVAIDGSEPFRSDQRHCPDCSARRLADGRIEYYHRAVWAFLVGSHPQVMLDVEPVRPGESEVAAAERLVIRLIATLPWIDVFLFDAGFAQGSFLRCIRTLGRSFIVRVKDEQRRHLLRDAQGLLPQTPLAGTWQAHIGHRDLQVRTWDIEGFTSWDSYPEALRVLIVDEEELPQPAHRRRHTPFPGKTRPRAFYATDLSGQQLPTRMMWEVAHRRWTLENTGFHQFKHEWHWNHPFAHDSSEALYTTWVLQAVAYNLFVAFVYRRLRSGREGKQPARAYADELHAALLLSPARALPYLAAG